ncbi:MULTISPECIES: pantoate--beta-alanine ligase [Weeksella]|uniref:pantoate--beta-alanine ligase n=1 Tax=Weeksella TaxID=1013 RepID=UPI0008A39294|nr:MULTISPECIES: pantoate--beta-alanine ligase [Weeksella]MDK7373983.1 pantoate--beta-alanine ligase [Weeksella virosa]OFM82671.1 pantoate--beta-alanine ligase [Weeksella sp. HMSC059D05]
MKIFRTQTEMSPVLQKTRENGETIGFVATMGALHQGHLALIQQAKKENEVVVVSIFVNPTQFNNPEDLAKYPRTEEKDIVLLSDNNCDFLYLPNVEDVYPEKEENEDYDFGLLDQVMEGKFRPGHFAGVATVVNKLLRAVQPTKAYFGEKDFQQVRIVQEMVRQEKLPVEIVTVPVQRAENGLALSSRNTRLTEENLQAAPFIYATLQKAKNLKEEGNSVHEVNSYVEKAFANSPFELEYFQIADEETLQPIDDFTSTKKIRAFVVAYAGDVRLIDNLSFS